MTLDELIDALQELRDGPIAGRFEVRYEGRSDDFQVESVRRHDASGLVLVSADPPRTEHDRRLWR